MHRILECLWNIYIVPITYLWNVTEDYGISMHICGVSLNIYGIYIYIWDIYGISMEDLLNIMDHLLYLLYLVYLLCMPLGPLYLSCTLTRLLCYYNNYTYDARTLLHLLLLFHTIKPTIPTILLIPIGYL